MEESRFFGQLNVAFTFGDVDVAVIAVLESIVEIQTAEPRYSPLDTGLRTNGADELVSILLLILGCVERILQFDPKVGLNGFAGHGKFGS